MAILTRVRIFDLHNHTLTIMITRNIHLAPAGSVLSPVACRWLLSILGILYLAFSYYHFTNREETLGSWLFMLTGLGFIVGGLLYSSAGPLARYVKVTDEGLSIKPNVLGRAHSYLWNDLSAIQLGHYEITLQAKDGTEISCFLSTRATDSQAAKIAIREVAETKGLPVHGG